MDGSKHFKYTLFYNTKNKPIPNTTIKIIYASKNHLLFALLIKTSNKPINKAINKAITMPSERFIGIINSLDKFLLLILVKLTIINENTETKTPIIVNILA